jgi:hypothetical protein
MAWVTANDMYCQGMLPLDVYDANGVRIRRAITGFNAETGLVESQQLDGNGRPIIQQGEVRKRVETYPAPLTWRKISTEDRDASKRTYLDLEGK